MFGSYEEARRAEEIAWKREHDQQLADRFGESLGISDEEYPTVSLDDLVVGRDERDAGEEW